jgi:hypothetical protein
LVKQHGRTWVGDVMGHAEAMNLDFLTSTSNVNASPSVQNLGARKPQGLDAMQELRLRSKLQLTQATPAPGCFACAIVYTSAPCLPAVCSWAAATAGGSNSRRRAIS